MENIPFNFGTISLLHEHLCLDFVNSTPNHRDANENYLNTYDDLVSWALDVKLLNEDTAQYLWNIASQHSSQSTALHQKSIVLREAIYNILVDIVNNQPPKASDIDIVNAALAETMSHMRLIFSGKGFDWSWESIISNPEYLIWRVAWSAGELLMSEDLANIRQCNGCDWLFLDTSRGHRRRWCDMRTCGNRAKARRHYKRKQED